MSEPRFLMVWGCTRNGQSTPAWPTTADRISTPWSACWCSWRLLGANNRELGRGAQVYRHAGQCLDALRQGQAGVIEASTETLPQAGQWTWRLSVAGKPFAVASRAYQRQRESHYGLQQFMLGLVSARVPGVDGVMEKNPAQCSVARGATCLRSAGPGASSAQLMAAAT